MLNKPDFIDEEQNYLLNSLLTLTQKNPAIWECVEYNPLSFLSSEEDDGTISACIVQMFVFQSELNQVEFELELSEHIDITTGKGDIYITLEKQSPDSYDKIDTGLSFETEYEDCAAEQIQSQFGNHVAAQMAEALVPPALQSDAASSAPVSYTHLDVYKRQVSHSGYSVPSFCLNRIFRENIAFDTPLLYFLRLSMYFC